MTAVLTDAQARIARATDGVGARDLFLFRRVSPTRFVHYGGAGRGEGWAGIVELVIGEEPLAEEALEGGQTLRRNWEDAHRVFGPYWARAAALVPVTHDVLAVFGHPDGPLAQVSDERFFEAGEAVAAHIHHVSPAKRLADELEVLHGVRNLLHCGETDLAGVMQHIAEHAADALSCEACVLVVRDQPGVAVATRRDVRLDATDEMLAQAVRGLAAQPAAVAVCVQQADERPLPPPLDTLRPTSWYLLPIGEIASMLLVHTRVAPRGFTLLCQELGQNLAQSAETMLRAAMARELSERIQQAQKLESLVVLAGGIAHDLNNLLVGVLGNAELARQGLHEGSPAFDSLEQIELAAQRAAALSRQLLAYSGKGRFVVERMELRDLVESMLPLFASLVAKSTGVVFRPDRASAVVEADGTELRQVLVNLVTNASEAFEGAPGTVSVRTGTRRLGALAVRSLVGAELEPGRYAFLEVADQGVGMDAETRDKIFEPYFSTKFTGRGLGLAAALGIVRGHGGALAVETKPGIGTVVTMYLPLSPMRATGPTANGDHGATKVETGPVLVVDDEPMVRDTTGRTLESWGFSVLTAASGEEALEVVAAREDVGAILIDVTMRGISGVEVVEELRARGSTVPVLLMSGYAELDVSQLAEQSVDFLQKPFRSGELVARLRGLLAARPAER
ncbi:MAG TPA: response regulator [Gaiellaceae bacterium]|nr:response regulator [Gaiellaceae bacterium]